MFFGSFWAYVGQPHDHIHWARSMPFASCNPTNPRTNLWNFHEKILRIGDFEKWPFLKNGHFGFFFQKKNFFLLHSHENQSKFTWYNGWVEILMFSLVSTKFLAMRKIALYSVYAYKVTLITIMYEIKGLKVLKLAQNSNSTTYKAHFEKF